MNSKIKTLSEFNAIKNKLINKTIVFTNGCFDIIHAGHISYLKKAKEMGDYLVVGLNSDESVNRIKGEKRPINSENDRALVLSALYFVDCVIIFNEDTPEQLIRSIKPKILVKGADWKGKNVAGCDFVKSYGGECVFIQLLKNRSTTSIVKKIVERYCKAKSGVT